MNNFWEQLEKPFFVLAPMEAVTDVIFRHVIASAAAPDVYFTEFTNTNSYCSPKGKHSTKGRLAFTDDEQPIVAHIWGDQPDYFAQMSKGMVEAGFKGIDINMGCPAPNVATKGCGSGLINHPETAAAVIAAAKTGGLPVSVKTRLGYSRIEEYTEWISHLLRQDIANLTIHLRTRKEMSKVEAHYELIDDILRLRDTIAPQTLITINGDIENRQQGLELVGKHPGVDGVMIGRGVFHDPFAFAPTDAVNSNNKSLEKDQDSLSDNALDISRHEQLTQLILLHLEYYDKYAELTRRPYDTLKRFYKIYVRDFDGAAEVRDQLMHTKSTVEARQIVAANMK